jgi:hypothetical protein
MRGRRRIGLLGTVLPAVLTTVAGVAVVLVSTSATPASRSANFTDRSPIASLDHFYVRPGGMRAAGWAFDPDAPHTALTVFAQVDHVTKASVTADDTAKALATLHPNAGTSHGYNLVVPVPEGQHEVCIYARNVAKGSDYRLGCRTQAFDYGPLGSFDRLTSTPGHIHLTGWTFDNDDPKAPVTVGIAVDGANHSAVANKARSDVASAHPSAGPNHGFSNAFAVGQGSHKICITAKNIGIGTDNSLGCKTITVNDNPTGAVEFAGQHSGKLRVKGWTFDRDKPSAPVTVHITIDSTTHDVVADAVRSDIGSAHPSAGPNHGYDASYTVAEGSHTVCVTAVNIGFGKNTAFACKAVKLNFTPTASLSTIAGTRTGAKITGWALDPDTSAAISVDVSVDGNHVRTVTANGTGGTRSGHNFATTMTLKSGDHNVCAVGINARYGTHNSKPSCKTITLALKPFGTFESLKRATGSSNLAVKGWALDPDTNSPISVKVTLDGKAYATVSANAARSDIDSSYPYGADHGISATVIANDGEHTVCMTAVNSGGGSDGGLGCKLIIAVHPVAPAAVGNVTALAGFGGATVEWTPPARDGGAPWTKYTVTSSPGNISATVKADATSANVMGLKPSTSYTFTVTATNVAGTSTAVVSPSVKTQASPPAQTTPAPVSTSRYIRNIRGSSADEQATMRAEGASDASFNPSGHGYLVLLDIGGQDQVDGGVVLSATTRFVSYGDLVADLKAYVDGYAGKQKASAPVTIALGTNNDMDVSATSGKTWATQVVNPVVSYAHKYLGVTVAGANDVEPGFRASYTATKNWLTGYLAATKAPFVFNGSADGCSWTLVNRGCNNGWNMSGLYYLAAGAAPVRMLNLPQIYNTTMAGQWKYISLTGVSASHPRINFGGTLTEWTACDQTNSCGSLTGHSAWSSLWKNLQSDTRLKVPSLPYSTDLRIDK